MFIPGLQDMIQMIKDRFSYQVKFLRWKTIIGTQRDGIQPELAGPALPTSVDMSWFITIKTIKRKIGTDLEYPKSLALNSLMTGASNIIFGQSQSGALLRHRATKNLADNTFLRNK